MASYEYYINTGKSNLNKGYDYTIEQIIQSLGGLTNPTKDNYTPAELMAVTDPRLRTIAEYLTEIGAVDYKYKYDDILQTLNNATNVAYDARKNVLADSQAEYLRNMSTAQETAADTIRNQYSQAIQTGISKGMQNANLLSTILGTSQAAASEAQALADERYQTGLDYQAQLVKDASDALTKSNAAYETLMSNIRQIFNDEIQQEAAELEYNASVQETNANYLANKYTADTNYATGINNNATSIYNNNQSALSNIISQAAASAAQDNYSAAYAAAAQAAAQAAAAQAAAQAAAAQAYSGGGGGGGGGTPAPSSVPTSTVYTGSAGKNSTSKPTNTATVSQNKTPVTTTASSGGSTLLQKLGQAAAATSKWMTSMGY